MLSGVLFRRSGEKGTGVQPEFVNQYILTDVYLHTKSNPLLRTPLLPSIATLVNPLSSLLAIILTIFRTLALVLFSHLPLSKQAVKRISVANTAVVYHDGRALATCESGPPIRVQLPSLETVGWFNGYRAENEPSKDERPGFGGKGLLSFMNEWTTGHPRVDPITKEFITFGATFAPPYVHYSIVPARSNASKDTPQPKLDMAVPGLSGGKMMHDFGVSLKHTVIMDLPLSLDPTNLAVNKPVVAYDPTQQSRFGVFPRYDPSSVRWFKTNPCCIFHTANCWTTTQSTPGSTTTSTTVNLIACRLTSASVVYSAGDISAPAPTAPTPPEYIEEEQCRLYYFAFDLSSHSSTPTSQWALSRISCEFPTVSPLTTMRDARYVYGCSDTAESFSAALGRTAKIDILAKFDVRSLIARGKANPPEPVKGCVDDRLVPEILASTDPEDPIQLFHLPAGHFAQECCFVPKENGQDEDDGWLLFYVFDESQLDSRGEAPEVSRSELWILDAKDMKTVVARVHLPQRVPYGLHGEWFTEDEIRNQRGLEGVRRVVGDTDDVKSVGLGGMVWRKIRDLVLRSIG
jgi:carotenoid cleavage dioxygenase-like enzyme